MTTAGSIKDAFDLRAFILNRSCREAFAGPFLARLEDLQGDYCPPEAELQREALSCIVTSRRKGLSGEDWRVRWTGNPVDEHRLILLLHSHVSRQASSDFSIWPTSSELYEFIFLLDQGMESQRKTFVKILPPRET